MTQPEVRGVRVTFEWFGDGSQDQEAADIVAKGLEATLDALIAAEIVDADMSAALYAEAEWS